MVRDLFGVNPDPWQEEALECFPTNQRLAMCACKGPGKTAVEAWMAWNFLLTRPHPKIAATSIDESNLRDNLWTEMAVWMNKSRLLQSAFTWNKTRIFSNTNPETWWMSFRTWPKSADKGRQADTLAGLHSDYIMFILDESGGIPDAVMVSAEAALSSCKEGHIVQAGNPIMREGPLFRACHAEKHLWHVINITGDPDNPKRSSRINIEWAKQQIETYGRDNPWVMVNVLGLFPPTSMNALIGSDEVEEAMGRYYRPYEIGDAAKVLGVDVAAFGDDSSVIFPRQGIQAFPYSKYRNLNSTDGASMVAQKIVEFGADATFVDATGGFGAGWIDQLMTLGHRPLGVGFAKNPINKARYYNKRVEIYFEMIEWIKRGGALPQSRELAEALTKTTYTFKNDLLILEPKAQVKAKIGFSPDEADALALTFAEKVSPKRRDYIPVRRQSQDYDPFQSFDAEYLATINRSLQR